MANSFLTMSALSKEANGVQTLHRLHMPWPKTWMGLVVSLYQEMRDGAEAERHHHPVERGLGSALTATT